MFRSSPILVMLGVLSWCVSAAAQTPASVVEPPKRAEHRSVAAARVERGAIVVDGALSEAAWSRAEAADSFVQYGPRPGAPASERTEARVLFDEGFLYVGMWMYDSRPDSVTGSLGRRDGTLAYSDWAEVSIDGYHDRRTALRFVVNPRGVQRDATLFDDIREDGGWDAVWEARTRVDSAGWTAEFRIPLSQLRFNPSRDSAATW
ncbi:MAG TPA: carbohydrate binding family 9 domain-containing protein, partial [Longimicrobium sp.]|nr:carbohydrate binding family 9 domain-containing protein [Longimicrobium sp.]